MRLLQRYFPEQTRRELPRLLAMMALFFLVVCAVGILRPIKNALALDGLGQTDFYKVYLVSAAVVLFVPAYNRLADRLPWRWLIPTVALTFALELLVFRLLYVEGSTAFGMIFYGWYDLFAAALVTQFFMATQLFFNARSAKQAYPLVIAGGSIGATLGGAITGFFSERVGTPNLLLVAAALITLFSITLPLVWGKQPVHRARDEPRRLDAGELRTLLADRHIRLIAISVLLTIVVKQLVDYQFNTMTKDVFQDRDAISAFQGKFNAVTQWLPIVALAVLQPVLRRWGVGAAVIILPLAMLFTNAMIALTWGLWSVVAAKGAETSLRYSTERAAREILYVPVPEEIKLKAKAYIDVAIEKGIGKVASALLIMVLLQFVSYRQITWFGIIFSVAWLLTALGMRREYVRTLARSIEGRFASLRGGFASLADANTREALRRALRSTDPAQVAFALELANQAAPRDLTELAPELNALLDQSDERLQSAALRLLVRTPEQADSTRIDRLLIARTEEVREAAVQLQCLQLGTDAALRRLLHSDDSNVRTAALSCLVRGLVPASGAQWITREHLERRLPAARAGDAQARREVALAAGALPPSPELSALLAEFSADPDPAVASAALRSAGRASAAELYPSMIAALARAQTRSAAREALLMQGDQVTSTLTAHLLDHRVPARVRREIPAVLAHLPTDETAAALLQSYIAAETDQLLDFRLVKAMSKLRAHGNGLHFDAAGVLSAVRREAEAVRQYRQLLAAIPVADRQHPLLGLLARSVEEAVAERRESVFRLLGLLYSPEGMRDCHYRLLDESEVARANATEWLETTIGHELFGVVEPVLSDDGRPTASTLAAALSGLHDDNDSWVARLARRAAAEATGSAADRSTGTTNETMDLIEKVFLLQRIDLLQDARSAHLALLATIGREEDASAGTVLIRPGEPASAMYVVVRGAVELRGEGEVERAGEGAAFGTWALIDQAPSLVEATAIEPTRLLRIDREDFYDLLNENPELAVGMLQGLARRVRALVA